MEDRGRESNRKNVCILVKVCTSQQRPQKQEMVQKRGQIVFLFVFAAEPVCLRSVSPEVSRNQAKLKTKHMLQLQLILFPVTCSDV